MASNFNFLAIITLILILSVACGVKSSPVPPPGTAYPTYLEQTFKLPSGTEDAQTRREREEEIIPKKSVED